MIVSSWDFERAQSMATGTATKFQHEILTINEVSGNVLGARLFRRSREKLVKQPLVSLTLLDCDIDMNTKES